MGSSAASVPRAAIERELAKLLASANLRQSRRRCDLLRWSVERVLHGNAEPVKEHEIGVAVFGKPESWDLRIDPIVRVEFNRLRQKLKDYYEGEGSGDAVVIEFPTRGYLPSFTERGAAAPAAAEPAPNRRAPSRIAMGAVVAAALAALLGGVIWSIGFRAQAPPLTSIAVLPFLDLSSSHQFEYLSDGFTGELTNALATVEGLRVISRTSAFQFKGEPADVRAVGRALQVGSVVEGSVLREASRVRIIVQLNRTADGTHLWQAQYDREAKDILAVQDEITQAVARALSARLAQRTEPAAATAPGDEALNEYMLGSFAAEKASPAGLQSGAAHFQKAIDLAPDFAFAYEGLGGIHFLLASLNGPLQQSQFQQARQYLERGVSLDARTAWPHAELAFSKYVLDWDWPGAEAEFQRALALGPSAVTHSLYAMALMGRGRFVDAERHNKLALELDPLNGMVRYDYAGLLLMERRAADARKQMDLCLRQDPDWFPMVMQAAYAATADHHPEQALEHLHHAAALVPNSPMIPPAMVAAYAEAGQRDKAAALMREIESHAGEIGYPRFSLAIASAFLGDTDRMFHWLEQAVKNHDQFALLMRVYPRLAPYQADPRMTALEKEIGLLD